MAKLNTTDFGHLITIPHGSDKVITVGTLCCVHCGCHWVPKPGSGRIRGYCTNCMGPVCGPKCAACVPRERQLQNMEQGKPLDFKPIIVTGGFDG